LLPAAARASGGQEARFARDTILVGFAPGVTGSAAARIAHGVGAVPVRTIGVDTHVGRLSQRLGFTTQTDPDKIEADLREIVPRKHQIRFCHLLQYHGRQVCFARKPDCPSCVLLRICPYPGKTTPPEPKPVAKRSRWV
jgi:endonuclease-3